MTPEKHNGLSRYLPGGLRWIHEALMLRIGAHTSAAPSKPGASGKPTPAPASRKLDVYRNVAGDIAGKLHRLPRALAIAQDEVALTRNGFLPELPPLQASMASVSKRVLYLAYNSLPHHSAGYATRTQGLVAGVREIGYDSTIVTRLGYPQAFGPVKGTVEARSHIEGVPYIRLSTDEVDVSTISTRDYIKRNTKTVIEAAQGLRPSIVHGASNFITGLTVASVGRALGIPSIYEVRGLWEITALSRDPSYAETLHFKQAVRLETEACLAADRVIAITQALKDELVRRGVPSEKIDIVPNGVDTSRFTPQPRDAALGKKLGLGPEHVVVGYVGSILDYEGLDDLLRATRLCVDRGHTNMRLLIVGDGAAYASCVSFARELGLDDYVIFTGRVPHHEVEAYYSLIDITPFPRKPLPVTEMVSPLKPFEAMAMGKCVIVSSVAAMAEIVGDKPVGFVHEKGSVESLAETLIKAARDPELRRKIGEEARRFVIAERDWKSLAKRVADIYDRFSHKGAA